MKAPPWIRYGEKTSTSFGAGLGRRSVSGYAAPTTDGTVKVMPFTVAPEAVRSISDSFHRCEPVTSGSDERGVLPANGT